jgi:phosphoribosylaminoimidazole-succinocarboxamide synthase
MEGLSGHGQCLRDPLPKGLRESDRLPHPIFTPATKATSGHDINISEAEAATVVGADLIQTLRDLTLKLYAFGTAHAESRGIILADTKFEFGRTDAGEILLIDEVMTPDSSRYWPKDTYEPGAHSRASTSSSCATTSNASSGTNNHRCRPSPTM